MKNESTETLPIAAEQDPTDSDEPTQEEIEEADAYAHDQLNRANHREWNGIHEPFREKIEGWRPAKGRQAEDRIARHTSVVIARDQFDQVNQEDLWYCWPASLET